MKTRTLSGAKALLYTGIVAGLILTMTACETATVEPDQPKTGNTLGKQINADDPPEKPKRPGD